MSKAESTFSLTEALRRNLVSLEIKGANADSSNIGYTSSHFGPCLEMLLTNVSSQDLNISLDYGYKLDPDDSLVQTMVVTLPVKLLIGSRKRKRTAVYAMCIQAHDHAPSSQKKFRVGKRTSGNLLSLIEVINKRSYQSDAGQNAVWCLTDNYDIESIYSLDTSEMFGLRRFVAIIKGLPESSVYTGNNQTNSPSIRYRSFAIYSGTISYNISQPSKVMIALFDEGDHMKKVYVNNENQKEGVYTYNYRISEDELENNKHYLRMIRNGKLEEEIAILPR